jgi:hypothetical protein
MRIIFIGLVVLVFAAVMSYATSWSVRGWVTVMQWDGKSPLECYGSSEMTVRGRKVEMSAADSAIVRAAGNCKIEIVDCNFTGPVVFTAGGNAHVNVRNSTFNGGIDVAGNAQLDFYASTVKVTPAARAGVFGNARVAFHDSHLEGKLERGGNAIVTGIAEIEREVALEDLSRRYGAQACNGVVDCYQKHGAFGNISGQLVVDIDAAGRASAARYESGDAPPVVRQCLIALGRTRSIEAFDGKPGRMRCFYAGSFIPGAMRMSTTPSFVRTE